ncbi:MAG: RagB/SusD family nutrient uptake outer membrane protein [Segetibacter sp.]
MAKHGCISGGATDAWGYNSIFMARNVKGKDVVLPYSSWYSFDYQNENREPTYRRTRFTWYFFYDLINQLNVLIDGTQKSATIIDADKNGLIAEAMALRAYFYFELSREFQFPILKDPNAPGMPIYTTPATADVAGNPRGTLKETYDQINSDIAFALQNLGTGRNLKNQVNLNVAYGMAARIYLEQGMWAEAEAAAAKAIEGFSLDAARYPDNYNGLTSDEVIWGFLKLLKIAVKHFIMVRPVHSLTITVMAMMLFG